METIMKIWQVNVYGPSHEDLGTYHFKDYADVYLSVEKTFTKVKVTQLNMDDPLTKAVWVYNHQGVAVDARKITFDILDGPTHF